MNFKGIFQDIFFSAFFVIIVFTIVCFFVFGFKSIKNEPKYGIASWYGKEYDGKIMANGKPFDSTKFTCATYVFDLGTFVKVVNENNNQYVIVEVTDRGPNVKGRIIDLSESSFDQIED